jgi:outer membrane protein assembly factor BamD
MKRRNIIISVAIAAFLWGCASKDDDLLEDQPLDALYTQGMSALKDKNYEKAAKFFDEVERQYPYSDWATQAQLMAAYCYYLSQNYTRALTALETFVQLHPSHTDAAYAHYLIGLCYYEQISSIERDQQVADLALETFKDLIRRFPTSKYSKDARYKMDLLYDTLAAKEMEAGRYYQNKKAYAGALNRFKFVVEHYQTTAHVEEALHRLVEVYLALGLAKEARKVAVVLGHNFPGSKWYASTYSLISELGSESDISENDKTWLDNLSFAKPKDSDDPTYSPEDTFTPPSIDVSPPRSDQTPVGSNNEADYGAKKDSPMDDDGAKKE